MQQKEIFANYELDDSRWKAALLTLLGGSLLLHLIFFFSAVYVPSVRDAFYIAGLFTGASSRVYIDENYVLPDIQDAEEVTMLSTGQLEYPAGYFQLANGDAPPPDFVAMTTVPQPEVLSVDNGLPTDNGFPLPGFSALPSPTPFPIATPYPLPNFNTSFPPVNSPSTTGSLPKLKKGKTRNLPSVPLSDPSETAQAAATPDKTQTAAATPTPQASPAASPTVPTQTAGFPINKKPLEDFGKEIKQRVLIRKDLDLDADFEVNLAGEFDKSGKVQKLQRVTKNGDEEMIKVAEQMLLRVNESGWLKYLEELYKDGNKTVLFSISQNKQQDKVLFMITAEEQTASRANLRQSTLNSLIGLAKNGVPGISKPLAGDEATIVNNTFVQTSDKKVIIKLDMPRSVAQEMINRKLTEAKPEAPTSQIAVPNASAVK